MKQINKTNLSIANNLLRQGEYAGALVYYERAVADIPDLSASFKYNIELCRSKLKNGRVGIESDIIGLTDELGEIKALLGTVIGSSAHFPMPARSIIRVHLESLGHRSPGIHHLKATILCALASPYQRALLCHLSELLEKLNLQRLAVEDSEPKNSLALLMRLASNRADWLMNRWRFKPESELATDPRLIELLRIPPGKNELANSAPAEISTYSWEPTPHADRTGRSANGSSRITFGTILLNEAKFIGMNLLQHYDYCDEWILVEGACQGYPTRKVSPSGLSLDSSAAQIRIFPDPSNKIRFIQHGWTKNNGEAAKSELRNEYIKYCTGDFLAVVDADEFYRIEDFQKAIAEFNDSNVYALTLPQVHFWKTTDHFITGEYYDIAHTRIYRYIPGMKYISNHNFPEIGGKTGPMLGHKKIPRTLKNIGEGGFRYEEPCCYHMGFAKDADDMRDKSDYYINRGEATTRPITTASRDAWFTDNLPEKCVVHEWRGHLPEVLEAMPL